MREEGNPPPVFEADQVRVVCTLPAHPRHAALRDLRSAEQALALGDLDRARARVEGVLGNDPLNFRAIQLFAEVHLARKDSATVAAWARAHAGQLDALPSQVLLLLGEAVGTEQAHDEERLLAFGLLARAARGRLEERELRRIVVALLRAHDEEGAYALIDRQMLEHPEWANNPLLLQLRGDSLIGMAKRCREMAKKRGIAQPTRGRAWRDFHSYLEQAERDLRAALALSVEAHLTDQIKINIAFLEKLRRDNQPPQGRAARGRRR
jgi:hypothetical protein